MTCVDVSNLDASGILLRLPRGNKAGTKTRRLVPVLNCNSLTQSNALNWNSCAVIDELDHRKKSTESTKDVPVSLEMILMLDNTPAFRDPNSNPTVEEEKDSFDDKDMYYLSDNNTNRVEVT